MKEKVGWGRTKNTGLNEAFFSQRTAAARQVRNFSGPRRFYVKGQVSRTRQGFPAGKPPPSPYRLVHCRGSRYFLKA